LVTAGGSSWPAPLGVTGRYRAGSGR